MRQLSPSTMWVLEIELKVMRLNGKHFFDTLSHLLQPVIDVSFILCMCDCLCLFMCVWVCARECRYPLRLQQGI